MTIAKLYGPFLAKVLNKEIDFDTDVIKVALCTSSYTPNQDTHDYFNDITNEVTGTGYTAGGATLASASIAYDTSTNVIKLDGNDVSWGTSTITARYAIIYDSSPGSDATRPLIGYVDFETDQVSVAGTFAITWNAAGIATVTVA